MVKRETKKKFFIKMSSQMSDLKTVKFKAKKKVVSTPLQTHPTAFVETFYNLCFIKVLIRNVFWNLGLSVRFFRDSLKDVIRWVNGKIVKCEQMLRHIICFSRNEKQKIKDANCTAVNTYTNIRKWLILNEFWKKFPSLFHNMNKFTQVRIVVNWQKKKRFPALLLS